MEADKRLTPNRSRECRRKSGWCSCYTTLSFFRFCMDSRLPEDGIIRFGLFELDPRERELRRSGVLRKLGPQPFQVLQALLERPGKLVTRDELKERLWPRDSFIDHDLALKKCVNRIREALGDSADSPCFVETVRGRGYRFVAPVAPAGSDDITPTGGHSIHSSPIDQADSTAARAITKRTLLAGSLIVVAALILLVPGRRDGGWLLFARHGVEPIVLPLISLPGEQSMPAFSPDGSRVAFSWHAPQRSDSGIYAVAVGGQSPLRLTRGAADYSPTWTPDGQQVAFLRDQGEQFLIKKTPSSGGIETGIYAGSRGPLDFATGNYGLSFSPDAKLLAFSEWNSSAQAAVITLLSLGDSKTRLLTSPPPGFHDRRPAFSPGGDKVAFVRSAGPAYVDELFTISLADGRIRQLTDDHRRIFGPPAWSQGGRDIVISSNRAGLAGLWRIPVNGGTPQPVSGPGPLAWYPSLAQSGNRLAYEHIDEQQSLWRLELNDPAHARGAASILVSSAKTYNLAPQFSPDGTKIAFQTERSGKAEVWVCAANGSAPTQLTGLPGYVGTPRWSPDGRYLAFDYRPRDHSEIDVVDAAGAHPHRIAAFDDADTVIPSWSHDGRWIYFASNHDGRVFQIWKVPLQDGASAVGLPVQVTRNGGIAAFESEDGTQVFFSKLTDPGIWTVPVAGGPETALWHSPGPDYWSNWALSKNGIYFFLPNGAKPPDIQFWDFKTMKAFRIATLGKPSFFGLTVSPDGKSLVYSQWDRNEHDILVVDNFR